MLKCLLKVYIILTLILILIFHFLSYINIKVNDLVLWKKPKQTSVIFFSVLIALWTIASFTLLSLASLLVMLTMLSFGSYRLYYSVMHKIKNTNDLISRYI